MLPDIPENNVNFMYRNYTLQPTPICTARAGPAGSWSRAASTSKAHQARFVVEMDSDLSLGFGLSVVTVVPGQCNAIALSLGLRFCV